MSNPQILGHVTYGSQRCYDHITFAQVHLIVSTPTEGGRPVVVTSWIVLLGILESGCLEMQP